MGKLRVGAADHHWFAESLDVWCHGVDLGAVNWSDERERAINKGYSDQGRVGKKM